MKENLPSEDFGCGRKTACREMISSGRHGFTCDTLRITDVERRPPAFFSTIPNGPAADLSLENPPGKPSLTPRQRPSGMRCGNDHHNRQGAQLQA